MTGWTALWVGLGGAAGAALRYGVARAFAARGRAAVWATLTTNLAGCLALGAALGWGLREAPPPWHALLATGLLGGFTTYSTVNVQLETIRLSRKYRLLAIYAAVTYGGGLAALAAGFALARLAAAR